MSHSHQHTDIEAVQDTIERASIHQLRYALSMINWNESTSRADLLWYLKAELPGGIKEMPPGDFRDFRFEKTLSECEQS